MDHRHAIEHVQYRKLRGQREHSSAPCKWLRLQVTDSQQYQGHDGNQLDRV